jgi:hypothetical protein
MSPVIPLLLELSNKTLLGESNINETLAPARAILTYHPATFMSLVPSKKLWEVKGSTMMLGLLPMWAVGCRHDRLHSTRTGYQSYLFGG